MKAKKKSVKHNSSIKKTLERQGYTHLRKRVGIALIILIIGLIVFTGYYLIYYHDPCEDYECFQKAINSCNRVVWIKDDSQASWLYQINGNAQGDACNVEVILFKLKQGTIDAEKLQGKSMNCVYQKSNSEFPEKDISKCSGRLKEELQDIIIQRMHNYLLENVEDIKEEF